MARFLLIKDAKYFLRSEANRTRVREKMEFHEMKKNDTSVASRIIAYLLDAAKRTLVYDVRIGLGYTAVRLADSRTGVAFTFRDQTQGGCSAFNGIRQLSARPAADLLRFLNSRDTIEAAVGLACANALSNRADSAYLDGDILDHVDLKRDDHVAMVGNFGPLVETIQKRAHSLTVFERVDKPSGILRPQKEALEVLPRCQVAFITATTIINHTVDDLLAAARDCREAVLLGASTPLVEEPFSAYKVTMLSGVVVTHSDDIVRVVSEGGGMRQFGPHVRKVTVRVSALTRDAEGPRNNN